MHHKNMIDNNEKIKSIAENLFNVLTKEYSVKEADNVIKLTKHYLDLLDLIGGVK